ncbi:uncharacterized protein [Battus philenor]|uniref:uncharacterized protein n=1 Tax=Battus philenor TaxID=42288 RepID=UPI0035CF53A9
MSNLFSLPNLKKLDLYHNHLREVPPSLNRIEAIDLAQNYMEEPDDSDYIKKKEILRVNCGQRWNGRKYEVPKSESIYSEMVTDDESNFLDNENVIKENGSRPPSSIEDWDSDEYWVPHQNRYYSAPQTFWVHFVKQKMEEGNFCPMDSHAVSVTEQVKYEKLCNPRIQYESDGQFDDYSSDDS